MEPYASEAEQVAAIKKWFKENGSSLVTGMLLAVAIVVGSKAWFGYQDGLAERASNLYAQMMSALNQNNAEVVMQKGGAVINEFSGSPYAALAALAMARVAIDGGDNVTARNHLQWAADNGKPEPIKEVARIRLINLTILDGELDKAKALLEMADKGGAYQAGYDELWGDLWVAKGDNDQAGEAYTAAINNTPSDSQSLLFLQLKLDETGYAAVDENKEKIVQEIEVPQQEVAQ